MQRSHCVVGRAARHLHDAAAATAISLTGIVDRELHSKGGINIQDAYGARLQVDKFEIVDVVVTTKVWVRAIRGLQGSGFF